MEEEKASLEFIRELQSGGTTPKAAASAAPAACTPLPQKAKAEDTSTDGDFAFALALQMKEEAIAKLMEAEPKPPPQKKAKTKEREGTAKSPVKKKAKAVKAKNHQLPRQIPASPLRMDKGMLMEALEGTPITADMVAKSPVKKKAKAVKAKNHQLPRQIPASPLRMDKGMLMEALEGTPITADMVAKALTKMKECVTMRQRRGRKLALRQAVNIKLKDRFVDFYNALQAKRGAGKEGMDMAYHGTEVKREESIEDKGLLVPGAKSGVKHKTDKGYYGLGIYVTPRQDVAMGYGTVVFVCAVLRGRVFTCKTIQMGRKLEPGFDSHQDPSGGEWILFNAAQVLPLYAVKF
eukprot:TRINITY_DN2489_c0_g1_i2.p1 TRINITY_DN2489_c0_g1~~TRINITY_DN2489_c0_g1_i2.p1  ORF type:complete len:350 (+),score=77.22 TRINITY_DN2489_c0_g1_i2:631-1680(+)